MFGSDLGFVPVHNCMVGAAAYFRFIFIYSTPAHPYQSENKAIAPYAFGLDAPGIVQTGKDGSLFPLLLHIRTSYKLPAILRPLLLR